MFRICGKKASAEECGNALGASKDTPTSSAAGQAKVRFAAPTDPAPPSVDANLKRPADQLSTTSGSPDPFGSVLPLVPQIKKQKPSNTAAPFSFGPPTSQQSNPFNTPGNAPGSDFDAKQWSWEAPPSTAPPSLFSFGSHSSSLSASGPSVTCGPLQLGTQQDTAKPATDSATKLEEVPIKQEKGTESKGENGHTSNKKCDPSPASSGPLEMFDARGDLTLVAGQEEVRFRVCSRSLARPSPVWERRLYGEDQQTADDWVISLPDDNPDGLRILLLAVHCKFAAIPRVLPLATLFHTTVLCERYDMVELLKSFWSGWIKSVKLGSINPGPETLVHQLRVAFSLGDRELYREVITKFLTCSVCLTKSTEISLVDFGTYNLYKDANLQSLGILQHIERGRQLLIRAVCERLRRATRHLLRLEPKTCRSSSDPNWKQSCDCAMLGALHRTIEEKNHQSWYPLSSEESAHQIFASVSTLVNVTEDIRVATIAKSMMSKRQGGAHHYCSPWPKFDILDILALNKAEDLVPMDVGHFSRQAAKSGLKDDIAESTNPPLFSFGQNKKA